jgi:hypothetical protein
MKQFLVVLLITIIALSGAETVLADTVPDRTRAVITRSTDVVERPDRGRDSEEVAEDTEEDGDDDNDVGEGSGVTLEVTYSNQGGVEIEFEAGDDSSDANISVSINGQSVSGTGGQQDGGNTSSDGTDGQDGRDGNSSEEEDEEEEEVVEDEVESNSRADDRLDRDERAGAMRDRR